MVAGVRIGGPGGAGTPRGLIPEATGPMPADMRRTLTELADLIERRADALADQAVQERQPWVRRLGPVPADQPNVSPGNSRSAPLPPTATGTTSPAATHSVRHQRARVSVSTTGERASLPAEPKR